MKLQKLACAFAAVAITTMAIGVTLSPVAVAKAPIDVIAEPPPEGTTLVSYADLNLTTGAGERTLKERVRGAVRFVCKPHATFGWYEYYGCRNFAWKGAMPQIERAVKRARDLAVNGKSNIPPVALAVSVSR
ncbi:UrcA family protein [Qipengyuania atrilutea]|uniref:UrcA family protein n=1 Tax=Qipengyuania atrilutea TaxID=2744473 RepID=A0A850H4H7_9SPHN|nr:UrcA family protein [Actirhodobacter atriluteus]NVD44773.1 UrcA family protein [Actirhodobacter atriluteus]